MPQSDKKDNSEVTEDVQDTSHDSRIDHLEMRDKEPAADSPETIDEKPTQTEENEKQSLRFRSIITRIRNFEFPARDDGKTEIQPWDIDTDGILLSEKKKHPKLTHYEKWLNKKKAKEGNRIICPKCGEVNYELPYVLGEKCTKCGFQYEDDYNIATRMDDYDKSVKGDSKPKSKLHSSADLKNILALPLKIRQNPNQELKYEYQSRSYLVNLLVLFGLAIAAGVFLPLTQIIPQQQIYISATYIFIMIAGIFAIMGLIRTLRVTRILIEKDEVTFSGFFSITRLKYKNILSIGNERHVNGREFLMAGSFHLYIFSLFRPYSYFDPDTVSYNLDDSSTSRDYTNNIAISTAINSVSFTFTGGENGQFIQALASIIYLARHKNENCIITPMAIKAAERGYPYYQSWRRGRKRE